MWFNEYELKQNLKLIKVEDNKYKISGKITGQDYVTKKIIVNGEEFTNTKVENILIDLDEVYDNKESKYRFDTYETDFMKYFDKPEISLCTFGNIHPALSSYVLSTNKYVSFIQILEENNAFPFKIYCGKNEKIYNENDFFNRDIEVILFSYGFNNSVVCFLSYEECLKTKFNEYRFNVCHRLKEEYFPKNFAELDEKQKEKLLKKFQAGKIRYNKYYK